jgi:radical SAM protein with 4Fe4S-binding SPASM domain
MCTSHGAGCYEGQSDGHPAFMPLGFFEDVIKQYVRLTQTAQTMILLQFQGEPLLAPDFLKYCEIVNQYESEQKTFGFTTNGSLLTEDVARQLLQMKSFGSIAFSLDGNTSHTFAAIRKKGEFNKVVANIEKLLELRKILRPELSVSINFTRQALNEQEYSDFVDRWVHRVNYVSSSYVCERCIPVKFNWLPKTRKLYQSLFKVMIVLTNGKVVPCCRDYRYEFDLGNLHESSLEEIWHGEMYVGMRELHLSNQWDRYPVCSNCYTWIDSSYANKIKEDEDRITHVGPYFEKITSTKKK